MRITCLRCRHGARQRVQPETSIAVGNGTSHCAISVGDAQQRIGYRGQTFTMYKFRTMSNR